MPTQGLGYVLMHATIAGAFFFALQRFGLGATLEASLVWAVATAAGAGLLAWRQSRPR